MKFYYFATILVGMMIILAAAGYDLPVSGGLLKATGIVDNSSPDASGLKDTHLWSLFAGIFIAGIGIVIGTFGRAPDINLLMASLVSFLAGAITADYVAIMSQLSEFGIGWISWSMGAFFSVLIIGFFISSIEFFRGTD